MSCRYLTTIVRKCSYKAIRRPNMIKNQSQVPSSAPKDFDLCKHLRSRIAITGPITVAEYMKEVLANPATGYYMYKDVFGERGDFVTSPEIGQVFGELVAIWCIAEWQKMGSPTPFQLIELGPGRGTLAKDILRVFAKFKMGNHFTMHLVEISPYLSQLQSQLLCSEHRQNEPTEEHYYQSGESISGVKIFWYNKLEDVPKEFSIVIAHEFFDALPIHILQKNGKWKEILIDVDVKEPEGFRFIQSNSETPISKVYRPITGDTRDKIEYSPQSDMILQNLTKRFDSDGGFGLIMDYGHFGDKSDTFRAFKNHKLHDPLLKPGTADLTADVDFKRMKFLIELEKNVITFGPVEQGAFLKRMGGDERVEILLRNASPENARLIKSGYYMLTNLDQMGSRFKFFSIFPSVLKDHLTKYPVSGFT